jgi:hypothetical protein
MAEHNAAASVGGAKYTQNLLMIFKFNTPLFFAVFEVAAEISAEFLSRQLIYIFKGKDCAIHNRVFNSLCASQF